MSLVRLSLLLCVLAACLPALAISADPIKPAQQGIFETRFEERSPHSDRDQMAAITHWRIETMPTYDVANHAFQLVVPESYDGSEAYGLLVFIHPNNKVSLDRFFGRSLKQVLAKHKLIWVSYSDAGNPVMPNIRLGLALDAVHNVKKQYRIDDRRVYVSGLSGGGRMTCMSAVYYPQVFTGAVPIVGSLYFRDVKLPEDPELRKLIKAKSLEGKTHWTRGLFVPKSAVLRKMKQQQRWVMLAGETDYNMPEMRAHYEQGLKGDAFEHAHYLEVPGMGHAYPNAEWYEKAIVLLDKPLNAVPGEGQPPADERTQRHAQNRLAAALKVLERTPERGKRLLELLIEQLPNTEAAKQAHAKLKALSTKLPDDSE